MGNIIAAGVCQSAPTQQHCLSLPEATVHHDIVHYSHLQQYHMLTDSTAWDANLG